MEETMFTLEMAREVGISAAILLVFLLLRKIFVKYVFKLIMKLSDKTPTELFRNVLLAFEKPLRWFFILIGLYLAIRYSPFFDEQMKVINQFYRASLVLLITWGLYNLTASSSMLFQKMNKRLDLEMDDIVAPFLSKVFRFVILALSFSIIAQEFNYDVNGFVAGLGLGGLAFALAAQDTIGNFFGGVIIITEKPFTIGDWIKTPSVEGVIEDISFRSTRIRTFPQALVTVPNSTLVREPITNWTKMGKRQVNFSIGVTYNTPEDKVKTCVKRIEEMLRDHEDINNEVILVSFDKFNSSSLDIFLYFFTNSTVWAEHLKAKQDVNFEIMKILKEENVEFAFPSQTLYVENVKEEEKQKERQYS
ncbi:mechanosensitive ion channel family protein [Metabacillus arenae]|uniref:Mechanosensitive ion channel family protein n=1 Tax=Metabacillus arenae TaxID=2771434 RepID=A0A926NIY8_9BACI|nr:mechanosensitive ion channel family protein [Metabacillus arenae]MBD1382211.1 mechanosensitive ion channel family protein [Metabacillus arenae]